MALLFRKMTKTMTRFRDNDNNDDNDDDDEMRSWDDDNNDDDFDDDGDDNDNNDDEDNDDGDNDEDNNNDEMMMTTTTMMMMTMITMITRWPCEWMHSWQRGVGGWFWQWQRRWHWTVRYMLYYGTYVTSTYTAVVTIYVTTIFRIRIVFSVRIASPCFRSIPFLRLFKWLGLNVLITFFKLILVNHEVYLYPDPKFNDARDDLSCKLSDVWTLV